VNVWPGARLLLGGIGGLAPAAAAVSLGLQLPLPVAERLLTALLLGCALYIPLLCWSLGAAALMRFCAGALGGGVLLVAVLLLLVR
jgi:hypothetical protein